MYINVVGIMYYKLYIYCMKNILNVIKKNFADLFHWQSNHDYIII